MELETSVVQPPIVMFTSIDIDIAAGLIACGYFRLERLEVNSCIRGWRQKGLRLL